MLNFSMIGGFMLRMENKSSMSQNLIQTDEEWNTGWGLMAQDKTYEVSYFGDLVFMSLYHDFFLYFKMKYLRHVIHH